MKANIGFKQKKLQCELSEAQVIGGLWVRLLSVSHRKTHLCINYWKDLSPFSLSLLFSLQRTGVEVGFKGCIRELETENEDLRERPLDLMISERNNGATNRVFHRVKKCGCIDHGCQDRGRCIQRDHDFRCECQDGYTGYRCNIKGKYPLKRRRGRILEGTG